MTILATLLISAPLALASPGADCVRSGVGGDVAAQLLARRLAERGEPCGATILIAPLSAVPAMLSPTQRARWRSIAPRGIASEGFAIRRVDRDTVVLTATGTRGLVYAAGWVLRNGTQVRRIDAAPDRPHRLTQIGYRAKNNSYDAWTTAMLDRRIEDFALWGASGVQVIAPVSDDAPDSPLFPAPPLATLAAIGRSAHRLGLDFALFYPELGDYADPAQIAAEQRRFADLVAALPRIDQLYVPGGDPGHTAPDRLFPLVAAQAAILRRANPDASVWLSTQGFDRAGLDGFYAQLDRRPDWLTGVFVGPQTRDPVATQRHRIPARYPLLLYPDIGHTMHAQFPVPRWHPAFALTQGREPINPRPSGSRTIFAHLAPSSTGFVTYSEGVNDDFNQLLWFRMGWDADVDPAAVARDYARMFIGDAAAAGAIAALERNWIGDPATNPGIDAVLRRVDAIRPARFADWRIDTLRYRACYDALVPHRLIAARARQVEATTALRTATDSGRAVAAARQALAREDGAVVATLRRRLFAIGDRLNAAARLQLSVARHGASHVERGANLDRADTGLNDRVWLERRMALALALPDEDARLSALHALADPERRREGALYDDLGDPQREPHLVRGTGFARDPQYYATAIDGIADRTADDGWRMAELSYAEALYDAPLRMRWTGLDRTRRYRIAIAYAGEDYTLPIRLVADGVHQVHAAMTRPANPVTLDFPIPPAATADGTLDLAWTRPPGMGGSGRGFQVAETWLIPDPLAGDSR